MRSDFRMPALREPALRDESPGANSTRSVSGRSDASASGVESSCGSVPGSAGSNCESMSSASTSRVYTMMVNADGATRLVRVKNTFLETADGSDCRASGLPRSFSDSTLEKLSEAGWQPRSDVPSLDLLEDDCLVSKSVDGEESTGASSSASGSYQTSSIDHAVIGGTLAAATMRSAPAAASLPSVGARLHATGECKPCLYVTSKVGCVNGSGCDFCHMPHVKKKGRPRLCKAKRIQVKQIVNTFCDVFSTDLGALTEQGEELSAEDAYMFSIIRCRQREKETTDVAAASPSTPQARPSHGRRHDVRHPDAGQDTGQRFNTKVSL